MRTTTLDGRTIYAQTETATLDGYTIYVQTACFYITAGDTWIYNRQGDKVAEVPDDRLREEILWLLNLKYGETK